MTLIELVTVMAIIAILSVLLYTSYTKQISNAKIVGVRTDFVQTALACEQYVIDNGKLPTTATTGGAFNPAELNKYSEIEWAASTSLRKTDPFGTSYQISYDSTSNAITVTSYGPDKNLNGGDDITLTLSIDSTTKKFKKVSNGLGKEISN
ncbi:prepilin-type N-terminal cleavage/methylation domain-containing protein [Aneurinibacillus soli]|uniref:Type II secretion system protein G n=2 Tax=Aneurinibacillus soli TaxID=1500254 RepID=A0A0U5AWF0_9BACL|nr:prepilin-type N-terminal cleavage/methylation domain-containing protein [Aneurinibacillus soli]BAU28081.1 Type II secretion system protein G precursor [Aneurinibacillus soli]